MFLASAIQRTDSSSQVRLASLKASVAYLGSSDTNQQAQTLSLMFPMLNTLTFLPHTQLPQFLSTLTPLASSNPSLFAPHLPNLLKFLPGLILPSGDPGPTPTVARPNPGGGSSFVFPPPGVTEDKGKGVEKDEDEGNEEEQEVRKAALEFMISLSEAKPNMVRRVEGWTAAIVRGCLEGMSEFSEDETEIWLEADVSNHATSCPGYVLTYYSPPMTLPTTVTLMRMSRLSTVWRAHSEERPFYRPRSSIYPPCSLDTTGGHGTQASWPLPPLQKGRIRLWRTNLGKLSSECFLWLTRCDTSGSHTTCSLVTPMFGDPHPRVRYAACQCM